MAILIGKSPAVHRPKPIDRPLILLALCGSALLIAASTISSKPALAAEVSPPATNSSADFSLEDLINIKVTSVSKKEERLNDAAAAVFVLSNDDLRRSGATSIAEALHLVPGLTVGQINASQWAISSRGFNDQYANKLLVMVDGRAVYTPTLAGVYWDLQQPMLEDVDRIEVIRGPGATVWGANAVNGVINVVSKSARDTQGGLVYGSGGNVHLTMDGSRYGGRIGKDTYYRVFGSYQLSDNFKQPDGQSARDGWQSGGGGFRIDHYPQADTHLTWQADATAAELNEHTSDAYNVNTVGRWTRELSERSSVEVQTYYDRTYRNESTRARPIVDTIDLTAQQTFGLGQRNDVIWGMGYRAMFNKTDQTTPAILVRNGDFTMQLFSAFIQDEFKLVPDRLILTAGTKIEHNDYTGFEIQPSVRAMFKPTENQTLWAAVSRAVRTPDVLEGRDVFAVQLGDPFPGPGGSYIPRLVGNGNLVSEVLWGYEVGYRIQPIRRVNVDVATFYNHYEHLINFATDVARFVPGTPYGTAEIPFENNQSGYTYGVETAVTLEPVDHWRLTGSYSFLFENIEGAALAGGTVVADPRHQAVLRSAYDFKRAGFDAQLRYVDQAGVVPAYVTADVRLSYRATDKLELSLVGQNLLDGGHLEAVPFFGATGGVVPRGFYGKITWRF
jgi:iron complex outermembrane recepter protein